MGIEPTSEAWEASILPLYDARSFLRLSDYTQRGNCTYRPAISRIFLIHLGKRPHALADRLGLLLEALTQRAHCGGRKQARDPRPVMSAMHDSFCSQPPRMVKTGQQASLTIL